MTKIPQAWVTPDALPRVLGALYEHMQDVNHATGTMPTPHIPEFKVCDDRGGSGHYWIRFEEGDVTKAQAQKLVGRKIEVTMEDL